MPLMIVWPESIIGADLEGRILFGQPRQRQAHLFLIGLGLRFHSNRDNRLREIDGAQCNGMMRSAQRVAGLDFLQSDAGADIARVDLGDVFTLVGVHLHQPAYALRPAGARIENRVAGLKNCRSRGG